MLVIGRRALGLAAVGLLPLLGACTKEYHPPPPKDATKLVTAKLGESVDYFGVNTTVLAIEHFDQSADAFPRLRVTVRSESTLPAPWVNPDVRVRCDESDDPGEWYDGSTWEANGLLPGGDVNEGRVIVGFPRKQGADLYPVPTCTNAALEVIGADPHDRRRRVVARYPLDDQLVQRAIDAPRV